MQRYKWVDCAEKDCSLGVSSRRCGTVSRRQIPRDCEPDEELEQTINKLLESAKRMSRLGTVDPENERIITTLPSAVYLFLSDPRSRRV